MSHLVTAVFANSEQAGNAVAELKQAGYTDDVSIVARDADTGEVSTSGVKGGVADGATEGIMTGATVGGLFGLLAGLATVAVPGLGILLAAGPLAGFVTGALTGAVAGGFLGALAEAGIPEDQVREYEDAVHRGEVLVMVTSDHTDEDHVRQVLEKHGASQYAVNHAVAL